MTLKELAQNLRPYVVKAATSLNDRDALAAKELYDLWDGSKQYVIGDRVRDDGCLYKRRQGWSHPEIDPPHLAPALWEKITLDPGTHDDPINYSTGMALEEGKYYKEYDVLYICIWSTGIPVYNHLSELVGIYVNLAE